MRDECEHGSLRRSCELCSRDLEIASLRSERDAESAMRRSAEEKLKRAGEVTKILFGVDTPDAMADEILTLRSERGALREALQKISALSVHEAEPLGDVNTDDTGIAFADGAWFGRWEAAMIARSLLSPARKEE